jgi:hypothetical protein
MSERMPFPTNVDVIKSLIEQHTGEMFVALPGTIQSYDPATQRADVVVGVRNPYPDPEGSGELLREDFPVIPHVKVLWPRMGSWFMAMSVEPGDPVQLLCNTLTPEDWFVGDGSPVDVGDTRRQHVAHAVALIGMNVNGKALTHAPPVAQTASDPESCLTLGPDAADGTRLSIYRDGVLKVTRGADVVFQIDADGGVNAGGAAGALLAKAAETNEIVSSLKSLIDGWTPTGTGDGASLKALIAGWSPASVATTKAKGV